MAELKLVTSIFDINRSFIDGRDTTLYVIWLEKFLELGLPLICFSNMDLSGLEKKYRNLDFRHIEFQDLLFYNLKVGIETVIEVMKKKSKVKVLNDITFLLPEYSIVQFSKFELLQKVSSEFNCDTLWLDSGASRFIFDKNTKFYFSNFIINLNKYSVDRSKLTFEYRKYSLSKLMSPLILNNLDYGTSKRRIGGTIFFVPRKYTLPILEHAYAHSQLMLENFLWDNEQVYLSKLFYMKKFPFNFIPEDKMGAGTFLRKLLN
jgi:hypothetical protein